MKDRNPNRPRSRSIGKAVMALGCLAAIVALVLLSVSPVFADGRAAAGTEPRIHKVQEGETLWSIAEKEYGDGKLWPKIWDANKDKVSNAQALQPGTELVIPPPEGAQPEPAPAPEGVTPPPAPVAAAPEEAAPAPPSTQPAPAAAPAAVAPSAKTSTSA